ncbi:ATP-binding protein [Serinibacter arcticus]|uniref:ATP-binding protein n=1 Tax=Serinibacter arcticus TaxID=1655435 RepID=UPI001092C715|nr:ATP-binding protein [Serinibacter arcticus]
MQVGLSEESRHHYHMRGSLKYEEAPPGPELMESMRAVGYDLETAVADIVDNSIAARATAVNIAFSSAGNRWISITDDGVGMAYAELRESMRLATKSPTTDRSGSDLGRFGLGLKTASLSQCRRLTVISRRDAKVSAMRWDLDHLASTRSWELLSLDEQEVARTTEVAPLQSDGTVVLWQNTDLLDSTEGPTQASLDAAIRRVEQHLSLVFHRFIDGEGGPAVRISINGRPIRATDPFMKHSRATQSSPKETIRIEGEVVTVQAYTLPHVSKVSAKDRATAHVYRDLKDSQGFYVYRARRLIVWGTWFRLAARTEMGKLARVQVDVPNTLDHLWTLDIKKSRSTPPPVIRDRLRKLQDRIVQPSRRTQAYRGRSERSNEVPVWTVLSDRDGFRYEVNRSHPQVEAIEHDTTLEGVEQILRLVEDNFPIHDVHLRLTNDEIPTSRDEASDVVAVDNLSAVWAAYSARGSTIEDLIAVMQVVEPYSRIPNLSDLMKERLQ